MSVSGMRRRLVILALITTAAMAAVLALYSQPTSTAGLITVSFKGEASNTSNQTAIFSISNSSSEALFLHRIQIQIRVNGAWRTVDERKPKFLQAPQSGGAQTNFSLALESGEDRKVVVKWPEGDHWRVCVLYTLERTGLKGIVVKTQVAWHTRSLSLWRNRVWGEPGGGWQIATSDEVKD